MRLTGLGGEDDSPSRREGYGNSFFSKKTGTSSSMVNSIQLADARPTIAKTVHVHYDEEIEHSHSDDPSKLPPKWDWSAGNKTDAQEHLVRFDPDQEQAHYPKVI